MSTFSPRGGTEVLSDHYSHVKTALNATSYYNIATNRVDVGDFLCYNNIWFIRHSFAGLAGITMSKRPISYLAEKGISCPAY